jgi:hypothetical protein
MSRVIQHNSSTELHAVHEFRIRTFVNRMRRVIMYICLGIRARRRVTFKTFNYELRIPFTWHFETRLNKNTGRLRFRRKIHIN